MLIRETTGVKISTGARRWVRPIGLDYDLDDYVRRNTHNIPDNFIEMLHSIKHTLLDITRFYNKYNDNIWVITKSYKILTKFKSCNTDSFKAIQQTILEIYNKIAFLHTKLLEYYTNVKEVLSTKIELFGKGEWLKYTEVDQEFRIACSYIPSSFIFIKNMIDMLNDSAHIFDNFISIYGYTVTLAACYTSEKEAALYNLYNAACYTSEKEAALYVDYSRSDYYIEIGFNTILDGTSEYHKIIKVILESLNSITKSLPYINNVVPNSEDIITKFMQDNTTCPCWMCVRFSKPTVYSLDD